MGIFIVLVPGQVENLVRLLQNKEARSIARHPTHREHHQQVPSVKYQNGESLLCATCYTNARETPVPPSKQRGLGF